MTKLNKNTEIPKFILNKRYLVGSVLFILSFSILFMAIYAPFSNTAWFSIDSMDKFGMTLAFYIVALSILFISKLIMSSMQDRIRFSYTKYALWIMGEVVAISLFYTYFTWIFVGTLDKPVFIIASKAFACVLLILLLPYTILTLYAAYKSKTEELEMLQYELDLSNESTNIYPSLVHLHDYNGTLKLTINSDSLYYMESQDNYIKIFYENNGKLCSYMLRSRTKTIEENLAETSMVRCQRSYLVNVMKINHIKKGGKVRYIVLSHDDIKPIPVSKNYFKNLIEKIDKYNSNILKHNLKEGSATEVTINAEE